MKKSNYHIIFFYVSVVLIFIFVFCMIYAINTSKIADYYVHDAVADKIFDTNNPSKDTRSTFTVYPLYHYTLKIISFVFLKNIKIAGAFVNALAVTVCVLISRMMLLRFWAPQDGKTLYFVDFFSVTSVLVGNIAGVLTNGALYLPQGTPNIWHSPTYFFVRPFGMLAFYYFVCAVESLLRNKKDYLKSLIMFSLLLCISCFAKPSFAFVFLPAAGIYSAIIIIKNIRHRLIFVGIPLLISVLPTIAVLLWQYFSVMTVNGKSTIRLGTSSFLHLSLETLIRCSISMFLFVFVVAVANPTKIFKNPAYSIAILMGVVGWFEYFFLTEARRNGDMIWGYSLGSNLLILISTGILLQKSFKNPLTRTAYLVYAVQLYYGINYIFEIFKMLKR